MFKKFHSQVCNLNSVNDLLEKKTRISTGVVFENKKKNVAVGQLSNFADNLYERDKNASRVRTESTIEFERD